jgi:hypothetical protein
MSSSGDLANSMITLSHETHHSSGGNHSIAPAAAGCLTAAN